VDKNNGNQQKIEEKEELAEVENNDNKLHPDRLKRIEQLVGHYQTEIIRQLDNDYSHHTKWSDRLADKIAQFGGSWKFIIYFGCFLSAWTIWNGLLITKSMHFDSPPFILLNLILSFIAAFQAPIIMMSQNRQAARDKHESIIDFAINYQAEEEINETQARLQNIENQLSEIKEILKQQKTE